MPQIHSSLIVIKDWKIKKWSNINNYLRRKSTKITFFTLKCVFGDAVEIKTGRIYAIR